MWRTVRVVRSAEMGYLRVSIYFSVQTGTLERDVNDISRSPEELVNVHLGRRTVLLSELENKLAECCIITDQRYYRPRREDIKRVAFQLVTRDGLKHPLKKEKSAAVKKWLRSFLKRHSALEAS